jgi:hypothetical protein
MRCAVQAMEMSAEGGEPDSRRQAGRCEETTPGREDERKRNGGGSPKGFREGGHVLRCESASMRGAEVCS